MFSLLFLSVFCCYWRVIFFRILQEKFGGEFTVTATLFTRKESKPVYRLTVLFRAVPFNKGDEVGYQGETYKVLMSGKKVMLQHAKTGKKMQLWHKDLGRVKKKEWNYFSKKISSVTSST